MFTLYINWAVGLRCEFGVGIALNAFMHFDMSLENGPQKVFWVFSPSLLQNTLLPKKHECRLFCVTLNQLECGGDCRDCISEEMPVLNNS